MPPDKVFRRLAAIVAIDVAGFSQLMGAEEEETLTQLKAHRAVTEPMVDNLGDVMVDGDDTFGDGVNVGARLQELVEPGGICISNNVVEDVH